MFGLIVFALCVCVCVHMHAFVLSFSHVYLLVCVRCVSSLDPTCRVFCIQGLVYSACVTNICRARIMMFNPGYTLIIIFISFLLLCGPGHLSHCSDWLCAGWSRV
jgi:hypothetical protein